MVGLHALKKVADLEIGIPIMAIVDFAAFAEESIRLIKKKDGSTFVCCIEDTAEMFLSLSDVFVHYRRQVDVIQVEGQFVGDDFSGHSFTGATEAGKECGNARASCVFVREAPIVLDKR